VLIRNTNKFFFLSENAGVHPFLRQLNPQALMLDLLTESKMPRFVAFVADQLDNKIEK